VDLREYYGNVKGLGFFATAHNQGQVDMAVYSRPRIRDEKTKIYHAVQADTPQFTVLQSRCLSHQRTRSRVHSPLLLPFHVC